MTTASTSSHHLDKVPSWLAAEDLDHSFFITSLERIFRILRFNEIVSCADTKNLWPGLGAGAETKSLTLFENWSSVTELTYKIGFKIKLEWSDIKMGNQGVHHFPKHHNAKYFPYAYAFLNFSAICLFSLCKFNSVTYYI